MLKIQARRLCRTAAQCLDAYSHEPVTSQVHLALRQCGGYGYFEASVVSVKGDISSG